MRSARVVSRVMRMMLGCAESSDAAVGLRGERGGCAAKHTSRISRTARTRNNRIRKRESSIARLPRLARRLELDLKGKVHVSRPPLCDHRVAGGHIRRLRQGTEPAVVYAIVETEAREIRPVQDVVHLPAQFHHQLFINFGVLGQSQVPLSQSRRYQKITRGVSDRARIRRNEICHQICVRFAWVIGDGTTAKVPPYCSTG